MRLHAYGHGGVLVELDSLAEVMGLHAELRRAPPQGLVDVVPAIRTLLVSFDPAVTTAARVAADIRSRPLAEQGRPVAEQVAAAGPPVRVPVRYDGEDLPEVAALTGSSVAAVVRRHTARTYVVAMVGFAPGFYFLAGGDARLRVARRPSPRSAVPKGAVALAGELTGIYPRTGPGGWQVIGHTAADLWDPHRLPPARLAPGTRVRFVDVGPSPGAGPTGDTGPTGDVTA